MFSLFRTLSAAAFVGMIAAAAAEAQTGDADDAVRCGSDTVPVSLAPRAPLKIEGELCSTRAERRSGTTVQLLIHGAATNHSYWDFGTIDGVRYSYARDVAQRGIATFAIDELGAGQSSHLVSTELPIQAVANATHQVVQGLRNGSIS